MTLIKVKVLLIFAVSAVRAMTDGGLCCPLGHFIRNVGNDSEVCWEPETDRNTSVRLTCESRGIVTEYMDLSFEVNDADLSLIVITPYSKMEFANET